MVLFSQAERCFRRAIDVGQARNANAVGLSASRSGGLGTEHVSQTLNADVCRGFAVGGRSRTISVGSATGAETVSASCCARLVLLPGGKEAVQGVATFDDGVAFAFDLTELAFVSAAGARAAAYITEVARKRAGPVQTAVDILARSVAGRWTAGHTLLFAIDLARSVFSMRATGRAATCFVVRATNRTTTNPILRAAALTIHACLGAIALAALPSAAVVAARLPGAVGGADIGKGIGRIGRTTVAARRSYV